METSVETSSELTDDGDMGAAQLEQKSPTSIRKQTPPTTLTALNPSPASAS